MNKNEWDELFFLLCKPYLSRDKEQNLCNKAIQENVTLYRKLREQAAVIRYKIRKIK